MKDQIAELKKGVEIIVCPPGRMINLLTANSGRAADLRRVTYVDRLVFSHISETDRLTRLKDLTQASRGHCWWMVHCYSGD